MLNSFYLKDKTIIITGASSGIGRQSAVTCSELGAKLALVGRNKQELESTKALCSNANVNVYCSDITEYENIEKIVKDVSLNFGKINGFIHSAGIGMTKPLKLLKVSDYEQVMKINVYAALEFIKILSKKKYLPEEGSSYVLISSVMGELGDIGNIAYCTSKSALLSAAKAIALELSPKKVRVNCVLPGVVLTEMAKELFETISSEAKQELKDKHPLGFGDPDDVANACAYLLSDASRWITGSNFMVDGGYSCH